MRPADAVEEESSVQDATLRFFAPTGQPVELSVTYGPGRPAGPGCRVRSVVASRGWNLEQYLVPLEGRSTAGAREGLEREIGAAVAISRRVADTPLRDAFLPFAGYDLDADEPFVLYEPPRGELLTSFAGTLLPEEVQQVVADLVAAVRVMEAVGVVRRDISPSTVRWDGERVQLDRPSRADMAGRPRTPTGAPPYAAPEQLEGTGRLDCRDDLWSVAQLGYAIYTGRPSTTLGPPPDLRTIQALAGPVGPLFAARAGQRPRPVEALRLLSRVDPLPPERAADALANGRAAFDRALRAKRQLTGGPPPAPIAVRPKSSWLRRGRPRTEES
jgi:serine/threonine protein kinase